MQMPDVPKFVLNGCKLAGAAHRYGVDANTSATYTFQQTSSGIVSMLVAYIWHA